MTNPGSPDTSVPAYPPLVVVGDWPLGDSPSSDAPPGTLPIQGFVPAGELVEGDWVRTSEHTGFRVERARVEGGCVCIAGRGPLGELLALEWPVGRECDVHRLVNHDLEPS